MPKKVLVISAVNFTEGGPLTILRQAVETAVSHFHPEWTIIVMAHDRRLIENNCVEVREYPKAKGSWFYRLWCEWYLFRKFANQQSIDIWLSLHDMTPVVRAKRQAVYCHNSVAFHKPGLLEGWLAPKIFVWSLLYRYLYQLNIRRNFAVIVQQEWMRQQFRKFAGVEKLVVAYPYEARRDVEGPTYRGMDVDQKPVADPVIIFYPALPRVFKNIQLLCEAVGLMDEGLRNRFELRLTVTGNENRYARYLWKKYGQVGQIKFLGPLTRQEMDHHYSVCDAVAFPSKLETWGLPISEAKALGKPLLLADLPYAHETLGRYDRAIFMSANDADRWAASFGEIVMGSAVYASAVTENPEQPFAPDWQVLWDLISRGM